MRIQRPVSHPKAIAVTFPIQIISDNNYNHSRNCYDYKDFFHCFILYLLSKSVLPLRNRIVDRPTNSMQYDMLYETLIIIIGGRIQCSSPILVYFNRTRIVGDPVLLRSIVISLGDVGIYYSIDWKIFFY